MHQNHIAVLSKKGEGLSLNMIVIAVLALIVLVVMILIFTGRISLFNKGVDSCPYADCKLSPGECSAAGKSPIAKYCKLDVNDKTKELHYCCMSTGDETP